MTRIAHTTLHPPSPSDLERRLAIHGSSKNHQPPHFPDTLSTDSIRVSHDFTPSKPRLRPPSERDVVSKDSETLKNPIPRFLNVTMGKLYEAGHRKLTVHLDEFDSATEELDLLNAKNMETLKEKCRRTQTTTMWDTARNIGAGILAAVSTFLGLSVLSAGGSALIGGALIASGIMSIANLAFTDAGLWDWLAEKLAADNEEKQQKIATLIPCILGLTAAAAGLAGLGAFAMWSTLPAIPQALAIVQSIVNFTTIVTTIGGECSQARVSWSQASLTDLEGKLALHYHQVERLSDRMEEVLEQETQSYRLAKSLLNLTTYTTQALLA